MLAIDHIDEERAGLVMAQAYNENDTRGQSIDQSKQAYPDVPIEVWRACWEAIDNYLGGYRQLHRQQKGGQRRCE